MKNHIIPVKVYILTFGALLAFTALTTWVAFIDLGSFNTPAAITIAVVKALLVVLFFMHLRYSDHLPRVFAIAGIAWLAILIGLTMSDFMSRGWSMTGR